MKKLLSIITLLLAIIMVLGACNSSQVDDSTSTTVTTAPISTTNITSKQEDDSWYVLVEDKKTREEILKLVDLSIDAQNGHRQGDLSEIYTDECIQKNKKALESISKTIKIYEGELFPSYPLINFDTKENGYVVVIAIEIEGQESFSNQEMGIIRDSSGKLKISWMGLG